jgi:hypothetical protein
MGKQMSDDWIDANKGKMRLSSDEATREAGKALGDLLDNGGTYTKQLFKIRPSGYFRRSSL